jgi:hypothetical protein
MNEAYVALWTFQRRRRRGSLFSGANNGEGSKMRLRVAARVLNGRSVCRDSCAAGGGAAAALWRGSHRRPAPRRRRGRRRSAQRGRRHSSGRPSKPLQLASQGGPQIPAAPRRTPVAQLAAPTRPKAGHMNHASAGAMSRAWSRSRAICEVKNPRESCGRLRRLLRCNRCTHGGHPHAAVSLSAGGCPSAMSHGYKGYAFKAGQTPAHAEMRGATLPGAAETAAGAAETDDRQTPRAQPR